MDMEHGRPASSGKRTKRLTYRGHKVALLDPGEPAMPTLSVDGTDIMVRREETGGYSAPMLNMFESYETLEDLVRALIDISPVFLAQRKS